MVRHASDYNEFYIVSKEETQISIEPYQKEFVVRAVLCGASLSLCLSEDRKEGSRLPWIIIEIIIKLFKK